MIKKSNAERRQYPRIEQQLPIKLAANGYNFATSTQNVSCVGTYCRVAKYMPPFTRVLVKLTLPVAAESGNKNYNVECKGVVVRSEDESSGGFNIAVFFNQINGVEKKKISEYVAQFLPKGACVLNRG